MTGSPAPTTRTTVLAPLLLCDTQIWSRENGDTKNASTKRSVWRSTLHLLVMTCLGISITYGIHVTNQLNYNKQINCEQMQLSPPTTAKPFWAFSSDKHKNMDRWKEFQADYHERFGRYPPDSLRTWLHYARYHNCNERDFYNVIEDDLKTFRDQIRERRGGKLFDYDEVLASGQNATSNYIAFSLKNHRLGLILPPLGSGADSLKRMLLHAQKKLRWILRPIQAHTPPLTAIFFINFDDNPPRRTTPESVPIFTVCKTAYFTDHISPPNDTEMPLFIAKHFDFDITCNNAFNQSSHQGRTQRDQPQYSPITHPDFSDALDSRALLIPYHQALHTFKTRGRIPPLSKRRNAIVWRGATTGLDWGHSPRFQLLKQYGGTEPHLLVDDVQVDFAFTDVVQNHSNFKLPPSVYRFAPRMYDGETKQYKYIMDVDGNAFTSRFPRLLQLGGVVFKSTRFREWFSERLQPFVDYIPVNYDLSDLAEKVSWVHHHPGVAEKIAQHGRDMSLHHIRDNDMRCYTYRLLLEYHSLFSS